MFFETAISVLTGLALLGLSLALRRAKIGRAVLIAIIAVVVILTLWLLPKEQIASLSKNIDPKDLFKAENDARTTLAQMVGGFAVLIGLYFAWKNITSVKEGQITERFTKAIDQLGAINEDGKLKLEVRLGGIYALERIARDSEKDHWPIMEILTAYVREHAVRVRDENPDVKPLTKDIQAILTVVGRRARTYGNGEDQALDLKETFLFGAHLKGAHLEGASLDGAHLGGANLDGAHLEGAHVFDAHLEGASLGGAHLEGAHLFGAHLEGAHLFDAHLEGVDLDGAHLEGASLGGAHLEGASLDGAHLEGAHLFGVDLSKVTDLTQIQLDSALGDKNTQLPPVFVIPESWT
jgi:hypothetical protein